MKIKVNGIEVNYEVAEEGKEINLSNPNSIHTKLYIKPIVKLFSQDFQVYCVDRRGCEKSTKDCELTYEESAKDIYEMIQKLKIDKPIVIGLSGGASVALHIAIKYPNIISKLILCSGSARKVNTKIKENEKVKTLVINGGIHDIIPVSEAEYLASNIKNSKIWILEKEKHCTYARKKYWYDTVKSFINE